MTKHQHIVNIRSIYLIVLLGTGNGHQDPKPQSWSVLPRVVDRGSPLDERLLGYITESLTVSYSE